MVLPRFIRCGHLYLAIVQRKMHLSVGLLAPILN